MPWKIALRMSVLLVLWLDQFLVSVNRNINITDGTFQGQHHKISSLSHFTIIQHAEYGVATVRLTQMLKRLPKHFVCTKLYKNKLKSSQQHKKTSHCHWSPLKRDDHNSSIKCRQHVASKMQFLAAVLQRQCWTADTASQTQHCHHQHHRRQHHHHYQHHRRRRLL